MVPEAALGLLAWYGVRVALTAMFVLSALDKLWHWRACLAQTEQAARRGSAKVMLAAAILVEGLTPLMIVTGWHDRLGAFLLAGFCVVTAFLYHPFWRWPGFWRPGGAGNEHFWQFWKNWSIVGGLMLAVLGGPIASPLDVLHRPLSSTLDFAR